MAREIALSRGLVALVDDEDYERLAAHKWTAKAEPDVYAYRMVRVDGKQRAILMHREIMGALPGEIVDHISGDGLDNQKLNLRKATKAQNAWNARARKGTASQFKGISLIGSARKWRAELVANGVRYRSSHFTNPRDAAEAYDELARMHHGSFARLNFPRAGEQAA